MEAEARSRGKSAVHTISDAVGCIRGTAGEKARRQDPEGLAAVKLQVQSGDGSQPEPEDWEVGGHS